MADRRIKKGNQSDGEKKEDEMRGVHVLSCRAELRHLSVSFRMGKRFLDFARNDKNGGLNLYSVASHPMTRRFRFGIIALTWLVTSTHSLADPTPVPLEHTNRLAHEKSPYLLQHAHNPVDWYPWGEDAFENEDVAAIMNREFVNIKVDREERPDVDRVYMTFVQATTGGGGWPMSVWLTPDLNRFVGGTYFPPEDRYGQPGFKKVLEKIATAWKENHDKIVEQGGKIVTALRESQAGAAGESKIDAK